MKALSGEKSGPGRWDPGALRRGAIRRGLAVSLARGKSAVTDKWLWFVKARGYVSL